MLCLDNIQPFNSCLSFCLGDTASDPLLASFCGPDRPAVKSTGRYMYISFVSDTLANYRGFDAMYQSIVEGGIPVFFVF